MPDVNSGPPARHPTLREERAQVTRRRIADAARRLFFRDGYAATTIARIATEADVAVQTVYAVYGSKARHPRCAPRVRDVPARGRGGV